MPILASYKECTGCMACVDSCKHKALKSIINKEGHLVPVVDKMSCVECKLCDNACPIVSKFEYTTSDRCDAYAVWAKNPEVRKKSATAGAFAAMAQYVLSNRGVVCGASIHDGTKVHHILIDNIEDLCLLQGSKYTQSNTTGIYNAVYQMLKNGISVLFSGTGCQIAGLYSFLKNKKYTGKIITVDLICGGVPSRLLIDKFIEGEPYKVKKIISFRTKENGWKPNGFRYNLKIEDCNGIIHDYNGIRNLITDGFACEMTNRYSCYKCKFSGTNRQSDFTIGDYWGVKDYKEQHKDGISVVIAHTSLADDMLKNMDVFLDVHPTDIDDVVAHNHRVVQRTDGRYRMLERKYLTYFFSNLSYKTLCRIYALQFNNRSLWMLYKIYRSLVSKILR